jgi:hypothetical protein
MQTDWLSLAATDPCLVAPCRVQVRVTDPLLSERHSGTLEGMPYDPEVDRLPEFDDPDAVADLFFLVGVLARHETDTPEYRDARARLDLNLAAAQARTHIRAAESAERLTAQLVRATYVLALCTLALVAATIVLAIRTH